MGDYVVVYQPDHPRAGSKGFVLEHLLVAEKALGRVVPMLAQVHHVDDDGTNNDSSNLVLCENQEYHQLLHRRRRSLEATGNPNNAQCYRCRQWDDPDRMMKSVYPHSHRASNKTVFYHRTRHGVCILSN